MTTNKIKSYRRQSFEELKKLVASKYPLVYIESWEEERVEQALQKMATSGFSQALTFDVWSETSGLNGKEKLPVVEAIMKFLKQTEPGLLLIKNFSWELDSPSLLKRSLRDVFHLCKDSFKTVFLLSPAADIPEDMRKEMVTLEFDLPAEDEMEIVLETVLKSFPKVKNDLSEEQRARLIRSALGLTGDEAKFVFQKMLIGQTNLDEKSLSVVFDEKARIVRREGLLEFVSTHLSLEDLGGLENLKSWLVERSDFFSEEARLAGLSMPKGILLTGVSGCGKSLACKIISAAWGLPLYRLDMNRVFGGAVGAPEEAFRKAILQMESVSPGILWIEEIEKGVAGYEQGDKGMTARIFSSFFTWLQEHKTPVFVAATANEINRLPPELLRKGRFDEIFFVDLPSEKEREQIFKVHLTKVGADLDRFNFTELSKGTVGFSGAEIEQCVTSGLVTAYKDRRRALEQEDIFKAAGSTVPLSTTMAEQIKEIKRWADTRAVRASKK